jgi:hypothetical protein
MRTQNEFKVDATKLNPPTSYLILNEYKKKESNGGARCKHNE